MFALCNSLSNVVTDVLIYYLFAVLHNSIWFLGYHYIFVDQSQLFSVLSVFTSNNGYTSHSIAIKRLFLFSLCKFGSINNKSLCGLGV